MYKCKEDGLEFETKEELIKHFLECHTMNEEETEKTFKKNAVKEIKEKLEKHGIVDITHFIGETEEDFELTISVSLVNQGKDVCLEGTFMTHNRAKHNYDVFECRNISDIIETFENFFVRLAKLKKEINKYENKGIQITGMSFANADSPSRVEFYVDFGNAKVRKEYNYHEYNFDQTIEEYSNYIKYLHTGELEGRVMYKETYDEQGYYLNGVRIDEFLEEGRKIKITVV